MRVLRASYFISVQPVLIFGETKKEGRSDKEDRKPLL
jgi:hypothetical protein